mmetsp:Transcript_24091/g.50016  ORF Transcript_24091/g.50016 Transcript_24091/m.50016 type:complete len:412 (+) Transcript_24091:68-1303(+)
MFASVLCWLHPTVGPQQNDADSILPPQVTRSPGSISLDLKTGNPSEFSHEIRPGAGWKIRQSATPGPAKSSSPWRHGSASSTAPHAGILGRFRFQGLDRILLGLQLFHLHCELDGISGRLGPQVIHARLEPPLPAMKMHGSDFGRCGINHVDVQGLGLIDVGPPICCHVQDDLLLDLPDRLIEFLHVFWQIQLLHTSIVGDQLCPKLLIPKALGNEVLQKVTIHLNKLSREHTAHIEVLRVGLEGLVVPQDLCGGGRGHWRYQQGIPQAALRDTCLELGPIPSATLGLNAPHVELQLSLRHWAPLIRLIGSIELCQFTGGLAGCEVDGLEDVLVQSSCGFAFERQLHHQKCIGQTLNPQTHRSVSHVGTSGFLHGVVVPVNDLVQILGHHLSHLVELLEVIGTSFGVGEGR